MAQNPFLRHFIGVKWGAEHRSDAFCFGCRTAFCSSSCADHAAHHGGGGGGGHGAQVVRVVNHSSGCPEMVATIALARIGYDLTHIQRLNRGAEKCIPIVPPLHQDNRFKCRCICCDSLCRTG